MFICEESARAQAAAAAARASGLRAKSAHPCSKTHTHTHTHTHHPHSSQSVSQSVSQYKDLHHPHDPPRASSPHRHFELSGNVHETAAPPFFHPYMNIIRFPFSCQLSVIGCEWEACGFFFFFLLFLFLLHGTSAANMAASQTKKFIFLVDPWLYSWSAGVC